MDRKELREKVLQMWQYHLKMDCQPVILYDFEFSSVSCLYRKQQCCSCFTDETFLMPIVYVMIVYSSSILIVIL